MSRIRKEDLPKLVIGYRNRNQLHELNNGLYKFLRRHSLLDQYFPLKDNDLAQKYLNEAVFYKNRSQLFFYQEKIYKYLSRHDLLDIAYPQKGKIKYMPLIHVNLIAGSAEGVVETIAYERPEDEHINLAKQHAFRTADIERVLKIYPQHKKIIKNFIVNDAPIILPTDV